MTAAGRGLAATVATLRPHNEGLVCEFGRIDGMSRPESCSASFIVSLTNRMKLWEVFASKPMEKIESSVSSKQLLPLRMTT